MVYDELKRLVDEGLSTYQIGDRLSYSQTNVRHWLKKYSLKTKRAGSQKHIHKECYLCSRTLNSSRRKVCSTCNVTIRRLRLKRAAFAYLGNECKDCGRSDGPLRCYDFHHRTGNKEFPLSVSYRRSITAIREELRQCDLLCSNCHRLEHFRGSRRELVSLQLSLINSFEQNLSVCQICEKQKGPLDRYRGKCRACYIAARAIDIRKLGFRMLGGRCHDCGLVSGHLIVYDFHHLDDSKEFRISHAADFSRTRAIREIKKCQLLCSFCHRKSHHKPYSNALLEVVGNAIIEL